MILIGMCILIIVVLVILVCIYVCIPNRQRVRVADPHEHNNEGERQLMHHLRQEQRGMAWTEPVPEPRTIFQSDNSSTDSSSSIQGFDEPSLGLVYGNLCSVCQNCMNGHRTIVRLQPCDHAFHKLCVSNWFETQFQRVGIYTCPICVITPVTAVETTVSNIQMNANH
jgi:hypothetical protein